MHQRFLKIESFIILSILIFLFFLFINSSWAAVRQPHSKQKRSVSALRKSTTKDNSIYIIRKGETLYRIAKSNGLSVDELKDLNGLKGNKLKIGQRLIINSPSPQYSPLRGEGWVRGQAEIPSAEERKIEEIEVGAGYALPLSDKEESSYNKMSEAPVVEEQEKGVIGKVLSYAKDLLGIPYRFGGTTLRAIDCSAFVQKVFKSIGIDLPRTAREQFKIGRDVGKDDISEGDLVFFKTYARYPSHVGIYIGDNQFIHASRKERKVSIDSLDEPFYQRRFIGAKRLIELEVIAEPSHNDKSS